MSEVILVRHGETEGQSSVRLYGATDIALSERGRRQMARVADTFADRRFERVVVSPLSRSRESAAIVLRGRGPAPSVVPAFVEIDFGRWEGWTWAEAEERDPEHCRLWHTEGDRFRFPGGESRLEFEARVAGAVPDAFGNGPGASVSNPASAAVTGVGSVLAVLHKGVIKVILGTLLGLPREESRVLPVDLGGIFHLSIADGRPVLIESNRTDHLGDEFIADGPRPVRPG